MSEILKRNNCYYANKVFGIAAVHMVRASTLVAERMCLNPTGIMVPVTRSNSGQTLVPGLWKPNPASNSTHLSSRCCNCFAPSIPTKRKLFLSLFIGYIHAYLTYVECFDKDMSGDKRSESSKCSSVPHRDRQFQKDETVMNSLSGRRHSMDEKLNSIEGGHSFQYAAHAVAASYGSIQRAVERYHERETCERRPRSRRRRITNPGTTDFLSSKS
ncbi:hypothetical protein ANN_06926 [Periplaneta americana]|uniref:Uncharacterized protein n=1 Tax=Periplaneta americana TaxID=6978 RepID=A0ABQ8THG6_PERAM|nr:hypothetical protein ANN_06926 [Periplaneta americana]